MQWLGNGPPRGGDPADLQRYVLALGLTLRDVITVMTAEKPSQEEFLDNTAPFPDFVYANENALTHLILD